MKVYISNYRDNWISPYTILEKVLFWKDWENIDYDTPWVERWSDRLRPVCEAWLKFMNTVRPRIQYVKIDHYDTWSMDHTLAQIILPMLKQLRDTKHGSPFVDDEDVPEGLGLRSTEAPAKENDWDTDDNFHKRWEWVLAEMIQAFECKVDDSWEDQYRSGEIDWVTKPCAWDDTGKPTLYKSEDGPNHTYQCDYDALQKHQKRNENGYRLFGKYYSGLWD
jgi:hypothetical protein